MPAKMRWSRRAESYNGKFLVRRWLDESRPPKKGGADPRLYVRTQEGKPWAERAATDERCRGCRLHAPLLEVHLRHGWWLRGRCHLGHRRHAYHQDRTKTLLAPGGGDVVR